MILFFANIYYTTVTTNTYRFLHIAFAYYHIIDTYRYYGQAGDCQPFLFMYIITAVYWTILWYEIADHVRMTEQLF